MPALLPYPRKLPPSPLILVLPCPLQDKQGAADPPRCCTKNPLRVAPVFYTCFMGALRGAPLWGNHVPGCYRGGGRNHFAVYCPARLLVLYRGTPITCVAT